MLRDRRAAAVAATALVLAATAAGCGSKANPDGGASGAATLTVAPASCPAATRIAPGTEESVTVGGEQRTYKVWLPTDYTGIKPVPLILNYHGTGGSPDKIEAFTGLAAKGNPHGYAVVAPQAAKGERSTYGWSVPGIGLEPDDVAFTDAIIASLSRRVCIDQDRIYGTGFSSGGAFSSYLACRESDRFAGLAPGGGVSLVNPASDAFCRRGPVPVFAYHGTDDPFVAYKGLGTPITPDLEADRAFFGDVDGTMTVIAAKNGCATTYKDQALASDVTLRVWDACEADTRILIVAGGGHSFPGSQNSATQAGSRGKTTFSVDIADQLLDWFDTQVRS